MALDDLLRALEEDAATRADHVRARARTEAERVRAEGEARLEERRAAELRAREIVLRAAAARALDVTRREGARRHLEARAAALERIRNRTAERLDARAGDPALLPLLRRDLSRALEYAGDGPLTVEASPGMLDGLRGALGGRPEATLVPVEGAGGVVLRAADGAWAVDATFGGRLRRAWPGLAIELARRLEPER